MRKKSTITEGQNVNGYEKHTIGERKPTMFNHPATQAPANSDKSNTCYSIQLTGVTWLQAHSFCLKFT